MLYRFYTPDLAAPGTVPLPDDQAHHAIAVLRLTPGTPVEVFNGTGLSGQGTLQLLSKRTAAVQVAAVRADTPPPCQLTLATAAPKADRAEWLVEQASQLNAAAIAWIDTQRSVVKPREGSGKMDKFHRIAIEAAKQCGRNTLLAIHPMRPLPQALADAQARHDAVWFLDPRQGHPPAAALAQHPAPAGITAFIGPEGGFTPEEEALLEQAPNAVRIRLTPTILRIETAAAAITAIINATPPNP